MTVLRIKTSEKVIYENFLKNDEIEISGIYGYENYIKKGTILFLSFGGNGGQTWTKGCSGIGRVSEGIYDSGYAYTQHKEPYYRIKIEILLRFDTVLERRELMFYPDSYDSGLGPTTKGERNQALGVIENDYAIRAICKVIIEKEHDKKDKLIEIFGKDIIEGSKRELDELCFKDCNNSFIKKLKMLKMLENSDFANKLAKILQTIACNKPEIIEKFVDPNFCKSELTTYYPILLQIDESITGKELKKIAKYNTKKQRYYYDKYIFLDKYYLITNDWYRDNTCNIQKTIDWISDFLSETLLPISDDLTIIDKSPKEFVLDSKLFNNKRYIYSLLTKPFVILSGNSGTGKTRIATQFAEWLGKKSDLGIKNSLIIPVGADWTDNTKLLGYYNPLADSGKGKYEKTEIMKFLEIANFNPKIPFFLILDEMNLSHVERYFSDFLSKIELVNYNDENSKTYFEIDNYGKLEFPKNLFITGTVNIDETTYMFSPKVLDRANVIEFTPDPTEVLNNFKEETSPIDITPVDDGSAEGFLILAKQIRASRKLPSHTKETEKILKNLSDILNETQFEFAYRTVKEIRLYLNAASKLSDNEKKKLEENDYISLMDEQLLQKILPKIHGNRSQIGTLLKNLYDFCDKKVVKLNETTTIQGYSLPLSKAKIGRMQKQLETSQFASFI